MPLRSTGVAWFGIAALALLVACKGSGPPSNPGDIANQPTGTLR